MIDRILRVEDFKRIIDSEKLNRNDLRICVVDKVEKDFTTISVKLSIPRSQDVIVECVLSQKSFLSVFIRDVAFNEHHEAVKLIKEAKQKAFELFGVIIEGEWRCQK